MPLGQCLMSLWAKMQHIRVLASPCALLATYPGASHCCQGLKCPIQQPLMNTGSLDCAQLQAEGRKGKTTPGWLAHLCPVTCAAVAILGVCLSVAQKDQVEPPSRAVGLNVYSNLGPRPWTWQLSLLLLIQCFKMQFILYTGHNSKYLTYIN